MTYRVHLKSWDANHEKLRLPITGGFKRRPSERYERVGEETGEAIIICLVK